MCQQVSRPRSQTPGDKPGPPLCPTCGYLGRLPSTGWWAPRCMALKNKVSAVGSLEKKKNHSSRFSASLPLMNFLYFLNFYFFVEPYRKLLQRYSRWLLPYKVCEPLMNVIVFLFFFDQLSLSRLFLFLKGELYRNQNNLPHHCFKSSDTP